MNIIFTLFGFRIVLKRAAISSPPAAGYSSHSHSHGITNHWRLG